MENEEIEIQSKQFYVHELPLITTFHDEKVLNERFIVGHKIYNILVAEGYRRLNLIYNDVEYKEILEKIEKVPKEQMKGKHPLKTERKKKRVELAKKHGLNGQATMVFSQFITQEINKNLAWAGPYTLGSQVVRKLGERVAQPFLDFVDGAAHLNRKEGKPKFLSPRKGKKLSSVESGFSDEIITIKFENGKYYTEWSNGKTGKDKKIIRMRIFTDRKGKNFSEIQAFTDMNSQVPQRDKKGKLKRDKDGNVLLQSAFRYATIVRRIVKGKWQYYVQLVLSGKPYSNVKTQDGKKVAIDLGISQYGIVSEGSYSATRTPSRMKSDGKPSSALGKMNYTKTKGVSGDYQHYLEGLKNINKKVAKMQKSTSRSDRLNNPHCYDENGKTIKGKRIIHTKNWKKKHAKLKELQRVQNERKKIIMNIAVKDVLRRGNILYMEKVSIKGWQKVYGKTMQFSSPGTFSAKVINAIQRNGGRVELISTNLTKLSQFCHICGKYKEKPLSNRRQECCGRNYQRDKYSAYLAMHTENNVVNVEEATKNEEAYEKFLK